MARAAVSSSFALGLLLLTSSSVALADSKVTCTHAYEEGQKLRRRGSLKKASAELLVCARECPGELRSDCAGWLTEVQRSLSSVVLVARTPEGDDLGDIRVSVDGQPLVEALDGRAVDVDPGPHTFRFERKSGAATERKVVLAEAEKSREILMVFAAQTTGAASAPSGAPVTTAPGGASPTSTTTAPTSIGPSPNAGERSPPASNKRLLPIVAGAVGVVALGSFFTFAVLGRNQQTTRLDPCRGQCALDDVQSVRTKFLVADVSLGVAIVSFGIGAVLWLLHDERPAR